MLYRVGSWPIKTLLPIAIHDALGHHAERQSGNASGTLPANQSGGETGLFHHEMTLSQNTSRASYQEEHRRIGAEKLMV